MIALHEPDISLLAESMDSPIAFKRIAMKEAFCSQVGSQEFLRKVNGLSVEGIVESIHLLLRSVKKKDQ